MGLDSCSVFQSAEGLAKPDDRPPRCPSHRPESAATPSAAAAAPPGLHHRSPAAKPSAAARPDAPAGSLGELRKVLRELRVLQRRLDTLRGDRRHALPAPRRQTVAAGLGLENSDPELLLLKLQHQDLLRLLGLPELPLELLLVLPLELLLALAQEHFEILRRHPQSQAVCSLEGAHVEFLRLLLNWRLLLGRSLL